MHRSHLLIRAVGLLTFTLTSSLFASVSTMVPTSVSGRYLNDEGIPIAGKLVRAMKIGDGSREHVLVLSTTTHASAARVDRIQLFATFYTRHSDSAWSRAWAIRDINDCPGLDASAGFFVSDVTFTDIDKDGEIEVTVPYHMLCAGGIEPRTVKVILREGSTKLAIRGESEVRYQGRAPFGGEHQYDKALLDPANSALRRHLDAIWKKVSIDKRQ